MKLVYKMRIPEGVDALADAGLPTAQALADASGISRGTAQRVMRGAQVSMNVAITVVHALQGLGAEVSVSTMFEEVRK